MCELPCVGEPGTGHPRQRRHGKLLEQPQRLKRASWRQSSRFDCRNRASFCPNPLG